MHPGACVPSQSVMATAQGYITLHPACGVHTLDVEERTNVPQQDISHRIKDFFDDEIVYISVQEDQLT